MLPSSSRDGFGKISTRPFVNLPIRGVAGDQQASLFGHCCFCEKEAKCTFGTGAFYLSNEGERLRPAPNGLLATIGSSKTTLSSPGPSPPAGRWSGRLTRG